MKPLFYAGQPGDGFGWGTCNKYLRKELSKLFELRTPETFKWNEMKWHEIECPWFVPIADHDLNASCDVSAINKPVIGYCFFESALGPSALYNSQKYDWIFAGSSWCVDRLKERGINHCSVLIQGVDHEIFRPMDIPRLDKRFRIFSGGKFEYRKGQDIVIAAFRELVQEFPEMQLVTAWSSPWPELMKTMSQSKHIKWDARGDTQEQFIRDLCKNNGIPAENLMVMPLLSHRTLAAVMNQTDLGVFSNRCEGGTNLVLMEYMSCGKPFFATIGTGHCDVVKSQSWISGKQDSNGWVNVEPRILADAVRVFKSDINWLSETLTDRTKWTWARAAKTIAEKVEELQSVTA